jgi:hypothetical protein
LGFGGFFESVVFLGFSGKLGFRKFLAFLFLFLIFCLRDSALGVFRGLFLGALRIQLFFRWLHFGFGRRCFFV